MTSSNQLTIVTCPIVVCSYRYNTCYCKLYIVFLMRTDITTFHETLKKNSLHVSLTKTYTIPSFLLNKNIITKVVCTKFSIYSFTDVCGWAFRGGFMILLHNIAQSYCFFLCEFEHKIILIFKYFSFICKG